MEISYIEIKNMKIEIRIESGHLVYLSKTNTVKPITKTKTDIIKKIESQLVEYFNSERKEFDISLKLNGTEFQKRVWKELQNIPYGETRSYKQMAIAIGNEKASRAIGNANRKNPISIIIPCHRVIGSDNSLVGYASGIDMKKQLLDIEKNS